MHIGGEVQPILWGEVSLPGVEECLLFIFPSTTTSLEAMELRCGCQLSPKSGARLAKGL